MLLQFFYSILREPVHKKTCIYTHKKKKKLKKKIHKDTQREREREQVRKGEERQHDCGMIRSSREVSRRPQALDVGVSSRGRRLARILTGSVFGGTSTSALTLLLDLHAPLHGPGTWTNLALALAVWEPESSTLEAVNDKTMKISDPPLRCRRAKGEVLTLSCSRILPLDPHVLITPHQ